MFRDSIAHFRSAACAFAAAAAIATLPLGGCGVKGPLKLPQPPAPATATPPAPPTGTAAEPPAAAAPPPSERKP